MSSYLLKISLQGVPNLIWRRFVVPSFTTLNQLDGVIRKVMGWSAERPHVFIARRQYYVPSSMTYRDGLPEEMFSLDDIVYQKGTKLKYLDDPGGAEWLHDLQIESTRYLNPDWPYPIYCLEGVRACPPEICRGASEYGDMLKILKNPTHPNYAETVKHIGSFDADRFSLAEVNRKFKIKMLPAEKNAAGVIPLPEGHRLRQSEKPDPLQRFGELFRSKNAS